MGRSLSLAVVRTRPGPNGYRSASSFLLLKHFFLENAFIPSHLVIRLNIYGIEFTISTAQRFAFVSDDNGADTAAMEVTRSEWPSADDTTRTKVKSVRRIFGEVIGHELVKKTGENLVTYRACQQLLNAWRTQTVDESKIITDHSATIFGRLNG